MSNQPYKAGPSLTSPADKKPTDAANTENKAPDVKIAPDAKADEDKSTDKPSDAPSTDKSSN